MVAVESRRKAIESLYDGECTITEYQKVKNSTTKMTKFEEVVVLERQPCRVSYERFNTVFVKDDANSVSQSTKLFIAPEVRIKPGSKITVTQNNVTTEYQKTGEPAVYSTHQEIELELFKGWA